MPARAPCHRAPRLTRARVHGQKSEAEKAPRTQPRRGLATNDARWTRIRSAVLAEELYTCRVCGLHGNHVDHIDGDSTNNLRENLQVLCVRCHGSKTADEQRRGRAALRPNFKKPPLVPVTVVCGPPGSGKTTYCRAQAGPQDLVVDLDDIVLRRSGREVRGADDQYVTDALRERNRVLASLAYPSAWKRCFLICMGPTASERDHWRRVLRADVVVLEVPAAECMWRIQNDPKRSGRSMQAWEEIVRGWWGRYVTSPKDQVIRSE